MGNTGMLGKVQIEGDWTQKRLILPVIQAALERTQLASPAIGPTMTYAKLKGTIPLLGPVPVQSQLDEFEHAVGGGGKPSGSTSRCSRTAWSCTFRMSGDRE